MFWLPKIALFVISSFVKTVAVRTPPRSPPVTPSSKSWIGAFAVSTWRMSKTRSATVCRTIVDEAPAPSIWTEPVMSRSPLAAVSSPAVRVRA